MLLYKRNASQDGKESHGRKIKADQSQRSYHRQSAVVVWGEWVQVNKIRFKWEHGVVWERVERQLITEHFLAAKYTNNF